MATRVDQTNQVSVWEALGGHSIFKIEPKTKEVRVTIAEERYHATMSHHRFSDAGKLLEAANDSGALFYDKGKYTMTLSTDELPPSLKAFLDIIEMTTRKMTETHS